MALIRGTIYKLSDDEGYFYFGSTIQTLTERFNGHKYESKKKKRNIYEHFTYEKFCQNKITIEVIEEVVVENLLELRKIESFYIKKYRNDLKLLNTLNAFRSEEDKINQSIKSHINYRNNHNEELKQKKKKEYYAKREDLKKCITCECGKQITKYAQHKHKQSQFHKDYISNNTL